MITTMKTMNLPITAFDFFSFFLSFVPSFCVSFLPSVLFFESLKGIHYVETLGNGSFPLLWGGRMGYFTFPSSWGLLLHCINFISLTPINQTPAT